MLLDILGVRRRRRAMVVVGWCFGVLVELGISRHGFPHFKSSYISCRYKEVNVAFHLTIDEPLVFTQGCSLACLSYTSLNFAAPFSLFTSVSHLHLRQIRRVRQDVHSTLSHHLLNPSHLFHPPRPMATLCQRLASPFRWILSTKSSSTPCLLQPNSTIPSSGKSEPSRWITTLNLLIPRTYFSIEPIQSSV